MFASRANQENVVYEQQQAAAAKPLNQGVKGLAPKTPANKAPKTPFKVPLNDENATGVKGKQNSLFGEGKGGKVDRNAFVTPARPTARAPLGNKTTNAKTTAFQTPAPPTQEKPSAKQSSPRMRRAKIKIHEAEAETVTHNDDEEEPDIEYMPPREVPLPDLPDDCWPHDRTYPQFEGANFTKGWWSEFAPYKDPEELSDFEEKIKQLKVREHAENAKQGKKTKISETKPMQKALRDPLTTRPTHTLNAKGAASALGGTSRASVPSFAAPTTTSKSRNPSTAAFKQAKEVSKVSTLPGHPRYSAARAASNSTLGYSKGRSVSGARKSLAGINDIQDFASEIKPTQQIKTSLDDLFPTTSAKDSGSDAEEGEGGVRVVEMDDGLDDFQLEI